MKKLFSKVLAFAFILCASIAMFACNAKKDINIKSIQLVGEMPEYIIIGEFDQAGVKILVTYEDDSTEQVTVTTSMIAEEDRHYLQEAGVYNVTILFKGEETILTVKMVEEATVNLVKFYDGHGRFIMSEFVLDGEDAVGPSAEWLTINGYNFVDWDRTITNVTEDINVYGIYSKIEDAGLSNEELKAKLISANKYFEEHDHIVSRICDYGEGINRELINYHYNSGNFKSQYAYGEIGSDDYGYADIDSLGYIAYTYDSEDGGYLSKIDLTKIEDLSYKETVYNIALMGEAEIPSISDMISNSTATYSTALYGNRNLYTVVFNDIKSAEADVEFGDLNVTIIYDDEKIYQIRNSKAVEGNYSINSYVEYATVEHNEYNYNKDVNIDNTISLVNSKVTALKYIEWTATLNVYGEGEYILTHIANSDTVTKTNDSGSEEVNLADLLETVSEDVFMIGAGVFDGVLQLYCQQGSTQTYYNYDENQLTYFSKDVGESHYYIDFDEYSLLYGDVNADGEVNTVDASMIQRYVADELELTEAQLVYADVNLDNVVDNTDALLIQKYSVKKIDYLPFAYMFGDVDFNGRVNTNDIRLINEHIENVSELTGLALVVADVNLDGNVDYIDVSLMRMYCSTSYGIESLPCETNVVTGDINLDGNIDSLDAEALRTYLDNNSTGFTFDQILNADIDKDGNVDEDDYTALNESL